MSRRACWATDDVVLLKKNLTTEPTLAKKVSAVLSHMYKNKIRSFQ